jgi:hypothetical protein
MAQANGVMTRARRNRAHVDDMGQRVPGLAWSRPDWVVLLALWIVILGLMLTRVGDPMRPLRGDLLTYFLPFFTFMGEQLRSGNIPAWNPHQFMGAPFAGDPQSGWMSLLVMGPFAVLPPGAATWTMMTLSLLLAATAAYVLGRILGLNRAGGLAAATVFAFTFLWERAQCCPQMTGVVSWAPVMLIGAEMGLRARSWLPRAGWWLLAGLAVSQVLSAWLGQGSYYQLMMLGGWIAFRALLWPVDADRPWVRRIGDLAIASAAILGAGILLDAAALLPRFEYNMVSNLAGGAYGDPGADWPGSSGGYAPALLAARLVGGWSIGLWMYSGAAATALAVLCPLIVPRWRPGLFLATAAAAVWLLAMPSAPLLDHLASLLPGFENIHSHYRERIVHGLTLPIGLLAGGTVSALTGPVRPPMRSVYLALAALAVVGVMALLGGGERLPFSVYGLSAAAAAFGLVLAARAGWGQPPLRVVLAISFALAMFWDSTGRLMSMGPKQGDNPFPGGFAQYLALTGAAEAISAAPPGTARYFGFDPVRLGDPLAIKRAYDWTIRDPGINDLLMGGHQATLFGIDDMQGYNPVHPERYIGWIHTLNGTPQLYRSGNIYPSGLDSPLLDLSNVRFAVVPPVGMTTDPTVEALAASWPTIYEDETARVLENQEAAPRAWVVNEARAVAPGEALDLLASGAVDGRRVALVEDPALSFGPSGDGTALPAVGVSRPNPDRLDLVLERPAGGEAMVVISEMYDRNWKAEVDGQPVQVAVTDHALMGVPIAAGSERVTLRYDPVSLRMGMAISLAAGLAVLAIWVMNGVAWLRRRGTR